MKFSPSTVITGALVASALTSNSQVHATPINNKAVFARGFGTGVIAATVKQLATGLIEAGNKGSATEKESSTRKGSTSEKETFNDANISRDKRLPSLLSKAKNILIEAKLPFASDTTATAVIDHVVDKTLDKTQSNVGRLIIPTLSKGAADELLKNVDGIPSQVKELAGYFSYYAGKKIQGIKDAGPAVAGYYVGAKTAELFGKVAQESKATSGALSGSMGAELSKGHEKAGLEEYKKDQENRYGLKSGQYKDIWPAPDGSVMVPIDHDGTKHWN